MSAEHPISNREFLGALGVALVALGLSGATLVTGFVLLFPVLNPAYLPQRDAVTPFVLRGKEFTPVVSADGGYDGDASVISALAEGRPDDQAILMRKLRLPARDYAFLRYHLEGRHPGLRVMLFWKTVDGGDTPFYTEMDNPGNGPQYHNLRRSEDWEGTTTELAIGFFGDLRGKDIRLEGVRLEPYSALGLLSVVWDEWTAFSPWDQKSINRYVGVKEGALLYPALSATAWLAMATLILFTWQRLRGSRSLKPTSLLGPALLTAVGLVWLSLHGLWLNKLWHQNQETRFLFHGKSLHERRLTDWDGEYYVFAERVRETLPEGVEKVAVLVDSSDVAQPFPQRIRYHLMPEINVVPMGQITRGRMKRVERDYSHLIILRDFSGRPENVMPLLTEHRFKGSERTEILVNTPIGVLLHLGQSSQPLASSSN